MSSSLLLVRKSPGMTHGDAKLKPATQIFLSGIQQFHTFVSQRRPLLKRLTGCDGNFKQGGVLWLAGVSVHEREKFEVVCVTFGKRKSSPEFHYPAFLKYK